MANAFRFYNSAKTFFKELVLAEPTANRTITFPDASGTVALESYSNSLLAEYTVTGSAVTSIDFSGLDINTHKSYRVEMDITNVGASELVMYCFINGDTILTNYYCQIGEFIGGTSSVGRINSSSIVEIKAGKSVSSITNISLPNNKASVISNFIRSSDADIIVGICAQQKTATVTNITQLTFTSSVASAIGVGSKIRIYRGNV